ncbi:MAG: dihydrodipicolinate synthase family protein [Gemmatimonadetes bacterium]|nr:dihydrodipicolinate synthase family protein [Gemmatimonadota bacterium]
MVDRTMSGVYPILQIPFDADGRIDEEDLRREVDWAIGAGVGGLCIAMASEVYKLSEAERDLALRALVDQAGGRVNVVMSTGAESTDVTILYSRRAEELGADALLIRPPTVVTPPADEVVLHFETVARAAGIPIFVQEQTGASIAPGLAVRIAQRHENLCYLKTETPPTIPRVAEVAALRRDGVPIIFGGSGANFVFEEVRCGSVGTMPNCVLPDVICRLWRMWHEGRQEQAEREIHRYAAFMRLIGQGQGLGIWLYKEALMRRGVFKAAYCRRPALAPDGHQIRALEQLMDELEIGRV